MPPPPNKELLPVLPVPPPLTKGELVVLLPPAPTNGELVVPPAESQAGTLGRAEAPSGASQAGGSEFVLGGPKTFAVAPPPAKALKLAVVPFNAVLAVVPFGALTKGLVDAGVLLSHAGTD